MKIEISEDGEDYIIRIPRDCFVEVERTLVFSTTGKPLTTKKVTGRERQILEMVLAGKVNKEIAVALNIEVRTAKFHVGNILKKFGCTSRNELFVLERKKLL